MSGYQSQSLLLSMVFSSAFVGFAVLTATSRRTWFVTIMTTNTFVFGVVFAAIAMVGVSDQRAQVVASLLPELPFIVILSWVCLAPAGCLPARFGTGVLETVARRPWLRFALRWAPLVLAVSWTVAVAIGLLWPSPALRFFAPAPPEYVAMKWTIMSTEGFYSALVGWTFLTAALRAPALRLRLKNLAFSLGAICWLLMALNAAANAGIRAWGPDGVRQGLVQAQLTLEAYLAVISMAAFAGGLAVRYVPGIAEALLRRLHEGLLSSQTRFESLKWRLVTSGKVRGVIRASQYAADAAHRANLTDVEVEKALTTLQLIAIFEDSSTETDALSPRVARELYMLQKEVMNDPKISSKLQWTREWRAAHAEGRSQGMKSSPLPEALEAALELTGHLPTAEQPHDETPPETSRPLWYYLAAVSATEAAFMKPGLVAEKAQKVGDHGTLVEAQKALQGAKDTARFLTLSTE